MEQNQISPPSGDNKGSLAEMKDDNVELGLPMNGDVEKKKSGSKMYFMVGVTIVALVLSVAAIAIASTSSSSSSSAGGRGEDVDTGPFFFESAEQFSTVCTFAGDVFAYEELPIQFFRSHAFGMCDENNQAHLCSNWITSGNRRIVPCNVCKCTPWQPIELQYYSSLNSDQMCSDADPSVDCLSTDFDFRKYT